MRVLNVINIGGGDSKAYTRAYESGENIFKETDTADSLFIIQRGQVRLFRPKGKGFVELAVLRTGEVFGEMACFDKESSKRNCSAAAIFPTEIVEIPFDAFNKMLTKINPWIETILYALIERLKKTNERVKQLELSSVGYGQDGKRDTYRFFQFVDILKMLTIMYFIAKMGEETEEGTQIPFDILKYYVTDIFNVQEVKLEELLAILTREGHLEITQDNNNRFLRTVTLLRMDVLKSIISFLEAQRKLEDDKKIKISDKCALFLKKILVQVENNGWCGREVKVDLASIIEDFQKQDIEMRGEDLYDAIDANICHEMFIDNTEKLTCYVNYDFLEKIFPAIRLQNLLKTTNREKGNT